MARPVVDWERVGSEYSAGVKSGRQIARECGRTEAAIRLKAKKFGWIRSDRTKENTEAPKLHIDEYSKAGFLYVIFVEDTAGKRIFKIGMTESFGPRMQSHQCSSPFDVRVACAFYVGNMRREEAFLHEAFASKCVRGEWFDLSDDDIAFISSRSKLT